MRRSILIGTIVGCSLVASSISSSAIAETQVLRTIAAWPKSVIFGKQFNEYVEQVNKRGAGVVKIDYVGSADVVPTFKQADALRRGVIDALYGVATNYVGVVPEADAMRGGNVTPWEARERGGMRILNAIWEKKLNARVVGWFISNLGFNLYLVNPPKFDASGTLSLKGFRLRSTPTSQSFVSALGGTSVIMDTAEVYTGLERGVVSGLVYPSFGTTKLGWDKFLKYRIQPEVLQSAVVFQVNLDVWKKLSPQAKAILDEEAVKFEHQAAEFYVAVKKAEEQKIQQAMKTIVLEGAARKKYVSTAQELVWDELKKRVSPESYAALRHAFLDESHDK